MAKEFAELHTVGAEKWACPSCLNSIFSSEEGIFKCENCGARVECTYEIVEMSLCKSTLIEPKS